MSEIKPVSIKTAEERYENLSSPVLPDIAFRDCLKSEAAELRAALEALQAENADLRYLNLSSMTDLQIKNRDLKAENAAQAERIEELKNDLIEWNEFKKIRDIQMQALRKQMP